MAPTKRTYDATLRLMWDVYSEERDRCLALDPFDASDDDLPRIAAWETVRDQVINREANAQGQTRLMYERVHALESDTASNTVKLSSLEDRLGSVETEVRAIRRSTDDKFEEAVRSVLRRFLDY